MHSSKEHRVCIVGAGPVGLSLALRLSDLGVASTVFDENPGLKQEGSKACLIQGDALEILDKSKCAAQIHAEGIRWCYSNVYIGGTRVKRAHYDLPNKFGPFVNISQYRIEQILLAEVQRRDNIAVEWSSRIIQIEQTADTVYVEVERAERSERLGFAYVAACNGVRSNIRDLVGVRWLGYRHRAQFLITDIRAKVPFSKERHFHFDPPFNRGYQVIVHPQPDDVWRIDWQLPPEADVALDQANGNLERRIRSVIGAVDYRLEWLSVYRFQQRIVDRFVAGRVIFAGDAAHALPPYGSRGMNSGIQDADNLAWKLALVIHGDAGPQLLESYHSERAAAAQENIAVTERTINFMVPSNPFRRLQRRVLFSLARRVPQFRRFVDSGRMAKPHRYVASPIVQSPETSAVVGTFAPDADVDLAGRSVKLRELLGQGFTFLYVGAQAPRLQLSAQRIPLQWASLPFSVIVATPNARKPSQSAASGFEWVHAELRALQEYEHGKWHLIRPDMHIGGVFDFQTEDQFQAALRDLARALTARSADGVLAA